VTVVCARGIWAGTGHVFVIDSVGEVLVNIFIMVVPRPPKDDAKVFVQSISHPKCALSTLLVNVIAFGDICWTFAIVSSMQTQGRNDLQSVAKRIPRLIEAT
jgi:hypothetical protein